MVHVWSSQTNHKHAPGPRHVHHVCPGGRKPRPMTEWPRLHNTKKTGSLSPHHVGFLLTGQPTATLHPQASLTWMTWPSSLQTWLEREPLSTQRSERAPKGYKARCLHCMWVWPQLVTVGGGYRHHVTASTWVRKRGRRVLRKDRGWKGQDQLTLRPWPPARTILSV